MIEILMGVFASLIINAQTVCVTGDMGTGEQKQLDVAEALFNENCQNILVVGDIIYPDGVQSADDPLWKTHFEEPYQKLIENGAVFYMALGNHDYRGEISAYLEYAERHEHFVMPDRYYEFRIDNLCVWALDTGKRRINSSQRRWLESSLANSYDCQWRFAFAHHPVKSSGKHGDWLHFFKRFLNPLLAEYGDVYLSGHEHHLSDEGWVKKNDQRFRQIIAGGGGAEIRDVRCRKRGCQFAISSYGFAKLTIDNDLLYIEFINDKNEVLYSTTQQPKSFINIDQLFE